MNLRKHTMDQEQNRVLTTVAPDRRAFLKRILATAGFVVPVVATFSLRPAMAFTTVTPTTLPVAAPGACLGGVGPLGCWPDA